jgi:hypothetical protein
VGIVFAAVLGLAHRAVPGLVVAGWRTQLARGESPAALKPLQQAGGDAALWYGLYQIQLIVGDAMLEGATFLQLIAYLLEGQPWSLAVAGLLVALLLLRTPVRTRVERWVERQQALVEQARQAGG